MDLAQELQARGFVQQHTGESLAEVVNRAPRVVYHGVDPTADSIHAGNFVQWMLLRHLAQAGHRIVLLVGGGTGMIGDPKPDQERPLLELSEVESRVQKLRAQAEQILGGVDLEVVNNYDWLGSISLLTFLRDVGKHFTVNELIKKDAIASRLTSEQGLSYTEFAYPLLQGYDYLNLYREKNCTLQTGGSDQWGNLVAGVDLIRRIERTEVHVLTTPLVTDKATGKKFGKSEGNAVWLDPKKTTPFAFYQFWLHAADESVVDYLKLFTVISLEEIAAIEQSFAMNPGAREAQKRLAHEVTTLVHGQETADSLAKISATLFGEVALQELTEAERQVLLENAPSISVPAESTVADALVMGNLATSKREARMFLESGAVHVGGTKITDINATLGSAAPNESLVLLKRGKRHVLLVTVT